MNDVIDLGRFDRSHSLPDSHHNHEFSDLKVQSVALRCMGHGPIPM